MILLMLLGQLPNHLDQLKPHQQCQFCFSQIQVDREPSQIVSLAELEAQQMNPLVSQHETTYHNSHHASLNTDLPT